MRGNGRLPLNQDNIIAIVKTLTVWETLSLQEAEDLLRLMDYPFQEIDWRADPWSMLRAASSLSNGPTPASQSQEAPFGQATQAGEQERTLYLQHMIQTNEWLILPGGREVPLEQIYVSLRADEMHANERRAEHTLYLEEVTALSQEAQARQSDLYHSSTALRKVITRHPKMFMLDARNWSRFFGEREQQSLTLAEVIKRHSQVVFLGDPGSGKTTLSKWLVLQFARALAHNDMHMSVPAYLIQPGVKPGKEAKALDFGPVKLPILVSIAQYARTRKPKEQQDRGVTLYEYLRSGLFLDSLRLPSGLSQEAAGAIVCEAVEQGKALIVLDGLDEVTNLTWRRRIMAAVRRFLEEWCPVEKHFVITDQTSTSDRFGNQVIITSRPVGYQFDPLVELPHYTLEDMDEQATRAFCHVWAQHVVRPILSLEKVNQWADQLHHAIFSEAHPGTRSMAGNPLLLTLIVQLAWKRCTLDGLPTLPTRRITLFEEVERTFYQQREALWEQAEIEPELLTQAFGAVAVALHSNETAGFATEEEVREQLCRVLGKRQVKAVLNAAREVSGFFIARGEGVYGFLHRAVQEYFAAQYLVGQSEQATSTVMAHALNPLWREPVVLAFGLMSRPRYAEGVLAALFTALQDLPDPAGSVLPRRELLAVAACVECERIPNGVGWHLARNLLSIYARRNEACASDVLQRRIQQAFVLCQRLPARARMEAEEVLCVAVQAEEFAQRFAAIDLIIETQWDAPAIAQALVVAWRTYADPAGSLLVALEGLQKRQPGSFHERLLPLKRQIAEKPHLWDYAKAHPEWQRLLQILYLPRESPFVLEQVNRDSPLTEEIITVLELATDDSEALLQFRQRLHVLAGQPGTTLARDAVLALSALDEHDWIKAWRKHVSSQERQARPALAALVYFFANANVDNIDRASSSALDIKAALFRFRDSVQIGDLRRTLVRNLSHDFRHALTRDLAHTVTRDLTRDLAHALDLTLIGDLDRLDELEQHLQSAKQRWQNLDDLVQNLDIALTTVELLKQAMHRSLFLANVEHGWVTLVDTYQETRKDDGSRSDLATPQITPETFPTLAKDLVNSDDEQNSIAKAPPRAFEALLQPLPMTAPHVRKRLLKAFKWQVRYGWVSREYLPSFAKQMLGWLDQETNDTIRRAMIKVLGAWQEQETARIIGMSLLKRLEAVPFVQDESTIALALAHLARMHPVLRGPVHAMLLQKTRTCGAALACLCTMTSSADEVLSLAQKELPDPARCFHALLEAGIDDDWWGDGYHGLLVSAAQHLLEHVSHSVALELLRSLLERLRQALEAQDWPIRRMMLAMVAACAETMPMTLRQAGSGNLESLIVKGAVDVESFMSRRFALIALSYLRTVTDAIVPVLLTGCQDIKNVLHVVDAVKRFQRIEGDLLSDLLPALKGESVSTAYAVAYLLGALGTSAVGTSAGLHEQIISALVQALEDPNCQRSVTIVEWDKGTLENALYDVLLQVAGWIG